MLNLSSFTFNTLGHSFSASQIPEQGFALATPVVSTPLTFPDTLPKQNTKRLFVEVDESEHPVESGSESHIKKAKISKISCIAMWEEMAGKEEAEKRVAWLVKVVEEGDLETLQNIGASKAEELEACLKSQKNFLNGIRPVCKVASRVDACCLFLLTKGAQYTSDSPLRFFQANCHHAAKAILNQKDPSKFVQYGIVRALLYPEPAFNCEHLLKILRADKSLCTPHALRQMMMAILITLSIIPKENGKELLKTILLLVTEILKIYSDFRIPLEKDPLALIVEFAPQKNGTLVSVAKSHLIEILLPCYFSQTTFSSLFNTPGGKYLFMELLATSKRAVIKFKEFRASFRSENPNVLNTINWIDDFIDLEQRIRKNLLPLAKEALQVRPKEEARLNLYLTLVLDSVLEGIPEDLQVVHESLALKFLIENLQLFRQHLLQNNVHQYDELLRRILEEFLFAFELRHTLPNKEVPFETISEQLIDKLKRLQPLQEDPAIPKGFMRACVMMLGGYFSETEQKGHGVVYVFEKNANGTFNFIIVNTGESAPEPDERDKTYDIRYSGIPLEKFTSKFLTDLLFYAAIDSEIKNMDQLLEYIEGVLGKEATKGKGRIHSFNQGEGNCAVKSQTSYTKYRLGNTEDPLTLQFKAFYTERLHRDFHDLSQDLIKNFEKYPFLAKQINEPTKVVEWLKTINRHGERILAKRKAKVERFVKQVAEQARALDMDADGNL